MARGELFVTYGWRVRISINQEAVYLIRSKRSKSRFKSQQQLKIPYHQVVSIQLKELPLTGIGYLRFVTKEKSIKKSAKNKWLFKDPHTVFFPVSKKDKFKDLRGLVLRQASQIKSQEASPEL